MFSSNKGITLVALAITIIMLAILTSVTINDGVEYIGQHAFYECTGLTSITIPGTVKTIERAIDYCQNLESIILKDGVENIEDDLASQCYNLKYVEIPGTVKKLNKYNVNKII